MAEKLIYSLGTSTRSLQEFIFLLKAYNIKLLVDVRSFPTSKFEHFKRENLEKLLEASGISYFYLGKLLGGFRRGGYEKYMETNDFKAGLRKLQELAQNALGYNIAFMCCERLPWRCHRRFIGMKLQRLGWQVLHIIDEGRIWQPKTSSIRALPL